MMTDIEKVIRCLEVCRSLEKTCADCPYNGELCTTALCDDALALLKEQQQQIWELQDQVEYLTDKQKEQDERIKELELEKGWDESPDMMGKW